MIELVPGSALGCPEFFHVLPPLSKLARGYP